MADKTDKPAAHTDSENGGDAVDGAKEAPAPLADGEESATDIPAPGLPPAATTDGEEPEPSGIPVPPAPAPKRRGGALAALSLLIALVALGLSGYLYYQSTLAAPAPQPREVPATGAAVSARLQGLQNEVSGELDQLRSDNSEFQQRLQREVDSFKARSEELRIQNDERLNSLQSAQNSLRESLLQYTTTDRSDWMLAEAEYLLRLANQRLIMTADTASAIALLGSADGVLRDLDDSDLYPVRAAIARDLAALRAVPRVDVEGTWLRIQALIGEIDKLTLFELPTVKPVPAADASAGWRQRLEQGLRAALATISRYVVVTRRDTPYEAALSPQWEGMVRQNLRMLLEQARAALLSGNQALYELSLENTRRWLNEFFSLQESGVSALDDELGALLALRVGKSYPDISGSLAALKTVSSARHMQAEEQ